MPSKNLTDPESPFRDFGVIKVTPTYPIWILDTVSGLVTLGLICLCLLILVIGLTIGLMRRYEKGCYQKKYDCVVCYDQTFLSTVSFYPSRVTLRMNLRTPYINIQLNSLVVLIYPLFWNNICVSLTWNSSVSRFYIFHTFSHWQKN